ncbi:hypothetical protein ISN44_As11g024100 [Arabidopsis suecica]|uniref:Reverse transcriptase domain-containing protein n=1 Tax=Arabidopsis suecica TaxID=45249 RepID=A0A8T1ZCT9_ARASU|nr:hypothetical protein ISN44_As11g024100 [Arabidopsis suecica]
MEGVVPAVDKEGIPPLTPIVKAPVGSWVKVVKHEKKSLTKYDLKVSMQDGVGSVMVPDEVFEDSSPLWEDFLIGKFLDTAPHVAKVHAIVNKIWAMGDKSQMIDVHALNSTTLKFRIVNPITRNRILRRGMWNLAEVPVVMSKWTPFIEDNSPEVTSVPLWVHLKNVPIDMFSWKGLSFVTSAVGEPDRLHPETAQCLDFKLAKVFVKADLSKELPKLMKFNHNGKETLIEYSYPWLPPRCSNCQKWGHLHTACVANKSEKKGSEQIPKQISEKSPEKEKDTQLVHVEPEQVKVSVGEHGSQNSGSNDEDKETGWSTVTPGKAGRSPLGLTKTLEYGEVSILSNSRFSVLNVEEEETLELEEETVVDKVVNIQVQEPENQNEEKKTVEDSQTVEEAKEPTLPLRQTLQRASKANHKFGGLMETRVKENKAERIVSKVFKDWSVLSNYEFNRLGRIWVVWSPRVRLTPCFTSGQMITCSVLLDGSEEEFFCSFVYASNFVEERKVLWEDLKTHQNSPLFRNKPWMIFGDFNEIIDVVEHSNYVISPSVTTGMRDFQDVIRYCSLLDMTTHGPSFTWCNKREEGLICKKLDRVIVNDSWLLTYPQSHCVFEAGGCSDHMRCRIQIKDAITKPRRPFKFTNALAKLPGFLPMIQDFWAGTEELIPSTSALFRLSKKLKALKPKIRELSKDKLSDLQRRTKTAYEDLCECQKQTLLNPSQDLMVRESHAFNKWQHLSDLEERFLRQRSKMHWLQVGDGNNRYFHQAAKKREVRNSIRAIKRADGTIAETQDEIKTETEHFFHSFLTLSGLEGNGIIEEELQGLLGFSCEEDDGAKLIQEVTEEEIKKTLFAMPENKSPGPDGFTCEFFKEAWEVVGKDFVVAIQSFFVKGFLPKGLNTTILALIPKKTEAQEMKDYRPISCCNVIYKVISKILANRLKQVLPKFISPNQSAFVKDRLLMENVLLASELVKNYHKDTVSARCAVKIDISKAFDSVHWPFLLSTLKALAIPEKFIHWLQLCITTASFSVQVNGELAGFFRSTRGLRQGCSLSPYLFVICMHVLSKMLDKEARERRIGYHPYCQNISLTHLCFADDLLVFSDGKKQSIEGILQVFQNFAAVSGLNISLEKSTLYMAGVSARTRDDILEQFPFDSGSLPVRYLGLPLLTKRMTVNDYTPLLEKIRSRIRCWTARYLSFAGRLQLIGSVIHSLTNFWISPFRLPKACIDEIDKLCAAFLWSGPDLNTKKAKVAWKDVCKPKKEGGLGLRSISEANKVSCLKLLWRILSAHSSLWVNWVRRYLIRKGSLWSVKETSSLGSWTWKKLLKYRDIAASLNRIEVYNGASTSFWFDNWSPMGRLLDLTGSRGSRDLGIPIFSTVESVLATHRRRTHRVEFLNNIEAAIDSQRQRGSLEEEDVVLWKHKGDKFRPRFSSKDTWYLTRELQPIKEWYKGIWFTHSTPKYSFMAWLAIQNRLSTGDRMVGWNMGAPTACTFCPEPMETRNHIFFECPYSAKVWRSLTHKLLDSMFTIQWDCILGFLVDNAQDALRLFLLRYVFQISIHTIWRERNGRRHGQPATHHSKLIQFIDKQVRNRLLTIRTMGDTRFDNGLSTWFATR